jgi:hypothetical protein
VKGEVFWVCVIQFEDSDRSYLLVAVSGPDFTKLGQSGQVNAFQVSTTSIPTSTSQPVPSATSSAKPTSTPSGVRRKKNLGAIIGGTLGGVAFLGLLATLVIVFLKRRRQPPENKRWTFHRDKMVLPPVLDIRPISPMMTQFSTPEDIEQGIPHDDIPTSPIAMIASPSGPRPLLKPLYRPLPPLPMPLEPRQEDIVEQMEQLKHQMTELEKNPGPTQHIMMDDLQKQMIWLQNQI